MTRRPSAGEIIDNFTREINNGKGNNSNVSYNNSNINININGDNHVKIKLQRNPSTPAPTSSAKLEKITKSKSLPASGASLQRLGIPPLSKVQNNSIYSNKSTKSSKSTYSTHSGYSSGYTQKTEDTDSICSAEHDDHEDRHIHCSGDGSKAKHAEGDGQQFAKIPDMHSFHGGTTADPSFSNNGDAGERLHRQAQSFHGGDRDRSLGRQGSGNSNTFASARRGSDTSLNCRRSSGRKYGGTRGFDVCPESTLLDLDGDIDKGRDGMADKLVNSRFHRIFNEEEFQRPRMSRQRNSYHDRSSHQDLSYGNYNTRRDIYDHRNRDQFDQEFHDNTTNQNQNGDSPRQRSFQYRPSKFSQSSSDILDGSSRRRSKHRSKSRDFGRSYNATSSGSDWDDHPNSSRRPRNSCSINNNNNNIDNNNNYDNNNERNRKCYERNKRRSNFSIDNRRASTESNPFPPEKVVSGGPIRQGSGSALYDTGPGSNSSKVPPPPPPPPSRFNNSSSNGSDHCRNNNNSNSNANPSSRTNAKGLKNDVNCTNDNNINTSNFSTYRVDELADRLINFSKRSSINNDPPRTSNANTTAITTAINSSAEGILKNPPPPPPRRANDDDNNNNSNLINRSSGPSSNLNSNSNLNLNHLNANSNTTSLAPNSPLPSMEEEVNDNSSFIEHVFAGVGGVIHTTSAEFNNSFTSLSISNSSVGNSGVSTTNNTFENNKATANNNSNNGSHPTTPIETMAPRPVRISQFIDLDETADDYHHSLPGSGSNNGSNPSTPTVSIMNASTLTSTIQNQQQQQHGNAIATKITVENSDALPSTCDKKGRCVRHPMVKLYKKKLLGGYEMIRDVCPKCEAEAPYEDLWKKRSRNINNNGGNVAVNSTPVRNRDRDEPVTTDLGHNSGNGNNRDDSIGDGDGNSHYDESQNSPFLPMHNLDSETQPQTQAPNSANRPKRLSRLANASFEISTTNSSINNNNKNNTRQRSASAGRASSIGRKSSRVGGSSVANESRAGDMASEIVSGHSLLDKGLGKLSKIHNKAMSHLNEGVTALTEKKSNEKFHVFDRKTGRCLRHPSIILAKKSTFKKGWDYVQPNGTCPLCLEAEANTSRRSASRGKESKGEKPEDDRGSEFSFSQDQIGSSGSGKPYRRKASEDLSFMSNNGAMTASPKVTPKARVATVAEGDSFQDYGNDGLIMDTAPPKETTARPSKKLNKPRRNNNNVNESIVDVIPYSSGINTPGNRSSRVSKMPYNTPWGESGWYTGEVNEAGVPHGQGRMRFKTGNSFEGQWVDGYSEQFLENRGRLKKGFGTNVAPWKQNTVEKNSPLTSGGRGVMSTSKMSSMPAPPFSMHQERSRGIPSYPQPMTYPPHQPHYRPGPVPPPPIFEQQNYPPQYPSPPHQGGMIPPFPPQSQPPPQQQWYGGEGGNGAPPPMGHPAYPPGFHPSR